MPQETKAYDAGDVAQTKSKKTKYELIQDREASELKAVLDTYEGRAVFWRLLSKCGMYKDSMTGDNRTFYYEGRRSIGLDVIEMIAEVDAHF